MACFVQAEVRMAINGRVEEKTFEKDQNGWWERLDWEN